MSRLEAIETAVRALLAPPNRPFWAPAPAPDPLDPALAALLPDLPPGAWQEELALALALRRNAVERQARLRAALTAGGLPDLLEHLALSGDGGWPALRLRLLAGALRADPVRLPPVPLRERVAAALRAALAYLDPAVRLPVEAWEVPRLSQPPEVGEGVTFPAAIIAEALQAAGQDPAPLVSLILGRRSQLGWSYWSPEHLPPDSDTLGQVLQALSPALASAERGWLLTGPADLAAAHIDADGAVPVFLADGATWSREAADGVWPVHHCPAVAANLFTGLWQCDPDRYGEPVQRGARWLLAWRERTGTWEGPSYQPPYGRYVACRLFSLLPDRVEAALDRTIREVLAAERSAILAEQRPDGSWGSPQATALALSTLISLGERGPQLDSAALHLTETQVVTGSWRSEPLWLTPGPGVYPATYYESVPVTTALCLRALARWDAVRRI